MVGIFDPLFPGSTSGWYEHGQGVDDIIQHGAGTICGTKAAEA
jgi:hypothetical protein